MLTSRFGFGYGMGYSSFKEAVALASLGHSITVVHCYSDPEMVHFYDQRIKFIFLPFSKMPLAGFLTYYFKLKKFINNEINIKDFDLIYIQSLEFGLLNLAKIKTPVFYFARSSMRGMQQALQNEGIKQSLLSKIVHLVLVALESRCMHYSRTIFVKSSKMFNEIHELYGINSNKLVVITGGIDNTDFQIESPSPCVEFKNKLKIPQNVPVVLYAGRIVPQKGLINLVEASLNLLREVNFIVLIAGSGINEVYVNKVKSLLDNSIYKNSFHFLGHINQMDMSLVLNSADCLVTPSLYEPFGMVNLQAAFLGKNIITTDRTGSIDLLVNYTKMQIVRAGSSADIELALKTVLLAKSQTNGLTMDFDRYSWASVARQLSKHFAFLLQNG